MPETGAVNVTAAPETGFPTESVTVTINGFENDLLIGPVCGLRLETAMCAAAPAVLVREKLAGAGIPNTLAVTVYAPTVLLPVNGAEIVPSTDTEANSVR